MNLEIRVKIEDGKSKVKGLPENYSVDTLARDPDGMLYLITCNSPERAQLDREMRKIYSQIAKVDFSRGPMPELQEQMEKLFAEEKRILELGYREVLQEDYSLFIGHQGELMEQAKIWEIEKLKDTSTSVWYEKDHSPGFLRLPGYLFKKNSKPNVTFDKIKELEILIPVDY